MDGQFFASIIDRSTNHSDRSRQAKTGILGVSDIGGCREYVRRMIVAEEPSQEVHRYDLAAFIGTALGDHMEDALIRFDPEGGWVKQANVTVELTVRGWLLRIPGHPDLYNRKHLIDFKSKEGLAVVRYGGPSLNDRFQRALYAAALINDGKMDEDCTLHNVYVDRTGVETEPYVDSEEFSWVTVEEAIEWLSDVIYAVQHDEEASRDKPRDWCFAACPFAPKCRGEDDSDVEGLITDPVIRDAVAVYEEAKARKAAAEKDQKSAASVLRGINGSTGEWKFRWVSVPPSDIPAYTRKGYDKLDLRRVRK
jgi:hypothetical protein